MPETIDMGNPFAVIAQKSAKLVYELTDIATS